MQMRALSELFHHTTLVLPRRSGPLPSGLTSLAGRRLRVETFPEPPGTGLPRKLAWLLVGLAWLPRMWRHAGRADAVHAVVPGDVGFLGLLVALLRHRRIFVRHCGTWGRPQTFADRLLHRLLLRVADDRLVVLATGGGDAPPAPENDSIQWIFSTSLTAAEIEEPIGDDPVPSDPPRLISIGRLTAGKNAAATVRALAELRRSHPAVELDVVGHGPEEGNLRALADELGLTDAVHFHGNVDHEGVVSRLRRADVLVFPTRVAEGFPKAVLEALAYGVPVVVPQISVLPHLLRHGGGIVVDDVEPQSVAAAIRDLLDGMEVYAHHAKSGRRIARRFTLEAWRDAIGSRLESAWGVRLPASDRGSEGAQVP